MSHDTNHGQSTENKTIISFKNSFWLVIIIVGLFIAALNFIQVESAGEGEGEGKGKEASEMHATHGHEKSESKAEEHQKAEHETETKEAEKSAK